ncbi:DddA-like double-stranded DNA deaminase toxin [Kribbella sp. NPDC056951]|uniref:DddA-like double-stranded DNA deaminase toxin n=1 Tax=Kribbella sp. NPDC056951 TaxID=3345978 RepID=UPI003624E2C3
MPSELQRVAAELLSCIDQIPNMVGYLHRTARHCREQAAYLIAFGSTNPAARETALQLDAAARACEEAAEFAGRVPQRARSWADQMVGGWRTVARSDRLSGAAEPSHEDSVARIMCRLPKRNPANSDPTTGIFIDEKGRQHDFVSGRGDFLERKGLDLCAEKGWLPFDRTSHAEIKFAMHMRLNGMKRATVYLNNEPCMTRGLNCRKLLPRFLPPGAQLVVYGPNGYRDTFIGKEEDGAV